jgi:hypothetical protein
LGCGHIYVVENKSFIPIIQKYTILFLVALALYCPSLHAQYLPTVEEGKEWTIELDYGLGSHLYHHYTLWCDTVIDGLTYLTIYNDSYGKVGYVREDTSRQEVYYLAPDEEGEELFLSYAGEAGDTIHYTHYDVVIQEVHYEDLFGALRKVLKTGDLNAMIEGAGYARYGIIRDYTLPVPWPTLIDLQLSDTSCEQITSVPTMDGAACMYPNPFTSFIHLAFSGLFPQYFEVYNTLGIRVLSGNYVGECTLDTSAWAPGLYWVVSGGQVHKMIKS